MDNSKKNIIIGAVVVLVLILIGLSVYLWMDRKKQQEESQQMVEVLEMDKAEMENEYRNFANQYNEMEMQVNNDSLVEQLSQQQKRTEELLAELKQTKSNDAREIMRLKKELAILRKILKSYIIQIDSLNRENQSLRADNSSLRTQNEEAQAHISNLNTQNEQLNGKVQIAAQLDATGIHASALNKKGKECQKVKDAKKIRVNFSIARNVTAETGMRTIYLRITTPTAECLSRGGSFQFENKSMPFSISKQIEYTGEEQGITVYWDIQEALQAGSYRVDIFADGHMIGNTSFTLK